MYLRKTWRAGRTVEVKKTYSARYGKKIHRGERIKTTQEAQRKVNLEKAVAELRRILNANFSPGDWHAVFTYPMKNPPTEREAAGDRERFLRKLRKIYADAGAELRYVVVTEYKHKRIHHHMVLNALGDMRKVKELWKRHLADTYYTPKERDRGEPLHLRFPWSQLDDSGQYGALAEYLVKETEKTHREVGAIHKRRYSCSRNLVHPKPIVEVITAKQWRKEAPERRGYYVDKGASYNGVSVVTGFPVQETIYVELRNAAIHPRRRC